jgi:psiF repeat
MWKSLGAVAFAALLSTGGAAYAQTKEKTSSAARSAASLECSRQAEEKGFHGKKRKTFRKKCMKEAKDKT